MSRNERGRSFSQIRWRQQIFAPSGIAVAAAHYRFVTTAPFPAPQRDAARAIQFLRSKATVWNIDPARVVAFGGSAGAGISLWLALHADLAETNSPDPVARQSTRLLVAMRTRKC